MKTEPTLNISDDEITFEFIKSSGPGGQNVNKVASSVRLRFNVFRNKTLSKEVKNRLLNLAGKRISKSGDLTIIARNSRRQDKNREYALERFFALLQQASRTPKPHKKTSIPFSSRLNRLETKKRRSVKKQLRRFPKDQLD